MIVAYAWSKSNNSEPLSRAKYPRSLTQARQQDFSGLQRSRGNLGSVRPRTYSDRRVRFAVAMPHPAPVST